MNYDQPRALKSGGWHYTSMNDGRVWPIGYCRDHRDEPHATEDEARRCYRRYELAECLRLDGTAGHWNPCTHPGCETLTNREAWIAPNGPFWLLCDEHRTRDAVAELYGEMAGDSVHS